MQPAKRTPGLIPALPSQRVRVLQPQVLNTGRDGYSRQSPGALDGASAWPCRAESCIAWLTRVQQMQKLNREPLRQTYRTG